jgi:hypothetical protein
MSLVFEDPPAAGGPALRFNRERSPERKQIDEMLSQLISYPEQWARLFDFPEEDKDGAEKMAGKVRSAAQFMNTGKAWSVTVRKTEHGYSVFAKMSSQPPKPRAKRKEQGAQGQQAQAQEPAQGPEATFQH